MGVGGVLKCVGPKCRALQLAAAAVGRTGERPLLRLSSAFLGSLAHSCYPESFGVLFGCLTDPSPRGVLVRAFCPDAGRQTSALLGRCLFPLFSSSPPSSS